MILCDFNVLVFVGEKNKNSLSFFMDDNIILLISNYEKYYVPFNRILTNDISMQLNFSNESFQIIHLLHTYINYG